MSRIMETKREILRLLSSRHKTMTDISKELELAPSTVCQHLSELESAGVINKVENPYARKWKYYKLAANLDLRRISMVAN